MRLTITKKIALAVIGIVMLSVGTMAWVTSQNLQRGFIAYLNEVQVQDLEKLRDLLAQRYRETGSLDWLRDNRRAMRALLETLRQSDAQGDVEQAPPARALPPPPRNDGLESVRDRPPRPVANRPPPRANDRPPPDPTRFGPRLSLQDEAGLPLIGPPDPPPGIIRDIVVDGKTVGRLNLEPLRDIASASDTSFIRRQIRDLLWLAIALIGCSILLAVWLARHFLRPIAGLRSATERIAQGQFDARAPVLNRDELSELAQHVNAMAQALELGEQQRRKMLADVSHELRTPLTVIRGEIEALLDGIRQADPRALDSLHAEVLRLNKLADDLHQITLADAGDLRYRRQKLDFGALLHDLLGRYKTRADAAGLTLSEVISPQPIWVHADPDRLTQVITNLLENSLRYTDAGGTVVCSLSAQHGNAILTVDDSAPGVASGIHVLLFERLYRVDQARSRERGGSGLGLSICKALVEAQDGDIQAQPSSLGGIRILVRIPLIAPLN